MSQDFESKPHDGRHPALEPGDDWRDDPGPLGVLDRVIGYGNYGGLGNRIMDENAADVAARKAADPSYSEVTDPRYQNQARYQPIDGIDAAAQRHDDGYNRHVGGEDWYSWQGMENLVEDDRRLVSDVNTEMSVHGSEYTDSATHYSEALRGFFGARVAGVEAADWAGDKAGEAAGGISSFIDSIGSWNSLDDAGVGLRDGATGAASWLGDTAGEAWSGISGAASTVGDLGWAGGLGAAAGIGNVALAGAGHLAGQAWSGVQEGASDVWSWLTD